LGIRWRLLTPAIALAYLAILIVVLISPLPIVRYHTRLWELAGRYLGIGWTMGREQALDGVVNVALFILPAFLMHRWLRRGSPPSWATAGGTLAVVALLASGAEFAQIYLPWRHASGVDVLTDVLGGACGVGVDAILARSRVRNRQEMEKCR
jgi:hypothetical protein